MYLTVVVLFVEERRLVVLLTIMREHMFSYQYWGPVYGVFAPFYSVMY